MKLYAPDYYNSFHCIAEKCQHNCCIGWEIDIDENSFNYYKSIHGEFGKRLTDNISALPEPHFILSQNQRCPFLNSNNLCDIITNIGEDKLCQICSDHPRYRNFFNSRTEIGLGLCCEAVASLVLNYPSKAVLAVIENDNEAEYLSENEVFFFELRDNIFNILQDRTLSINNRVKNLLLKYDVSLPKKSITEWAELFLSLEHLNQSWCDRLELLKSTRLSKNTPFIDKQFETAFEQLLIYFIYRHFSNCLFDGRFYERIGFCVLSYKIIYSLCLVQYETEGSVSIDDLTEISRLYSSEIEYSAENIELLLNSLS